MILSADELEIMEYLKSWKGASVAMLEICRCAGGRKKFRTDPNWAKCMMTRLVDANLVQVNERGHYRFPVEDAAATETLSASLDSKHSENSQPSEARVVGDDYFPSCESDPEAETKWWLSPQIIELFKNSKEDK